MKENLASIALIVSLVSLFFTLRNNSFNKKIKLVEAKIAMLALLSEISSRYAKLEASLHEVKIKAEKHPKYLEIRESIDPLENQYSQLVRELSKAYRECTAIKDSEILTEYERSFPLIRSISHTTDVFESNVRKLLEGLTPKTQT